MRAGRLLALSFAIALVSPADAAPLKQAAKRQKLAAAVFDAQAVALKLASDDAETIATGLLLVRASVASSTGLAPLIDRLLRRGLPFDLTRLALAAAGDLAQPASSVAIRPYIGHREVEIRRLAVRSIARTRGSHAASGLRAALSDGDRHVRGLAALGLGAIGAHDAVGDLRAALDRQVLEAAVALGQLCRGAECDPLVASLAKLPSDVTLDAIGALLARPTGEVSEELKLRLVRQVRDAGTPEAKLFLVSALGRFSGSPGVRAALAQAVHSSEAAPVKP